MINRRVIEALNMSVNISELLELAGVEIPYNGVVFCPFHPNVNTKSGKVFTDTNKLYCFSEQKLYGSYDVMKMLLKWDEAKILSKLPKDIALKMVDFKNGEVKIPIVDKQTVQEFKNDKDLPKYLNVLNKFWTYRDKLEQEVL